MVRMELLKAAFYVAKSINISDVKSHPHIVKDGGMKTQHAAKLLELCKGKRNTCHTGLTFPSLSTRTLNNMYNRYDYNIFVDQSDKLNLNADIYTTFKISTPVTK